MAKKTSKPISLDRNDIILGADAETIRAALEAREKIDVLLNERAEAYRKIAELENQVDDLRGDDTEFPFPEPELPVASFGARPKPAKKRPAAPKPSSALKDPVASGPVPELNPGSVEKESDRPADDESSDDSKES
ncbi:MAG: hypothetical protein ACQKBT_09795 [Puniceicoccales bacterium]